MGDTLQHQNKILDRVSDKVTCVNDTTITVTIKAAQLSHRIKGSKAKFFGIFQFKAIKTDKYLAVKDTFLILQERCDRSTYFNCYLKEDTLVGIQNRKTLKFVGVTAWGSIRCSGEYFGKSEDCSLDLASEQSGLLFLSCNWGSGGWLKSSTEIDGIHEAIYSEVTKSIENKNNFELFQKIEINEATLK